MSKNSFVAELTFKQTCSFQLQVYLSIYNYLLPPGIEGFKGNILQWLLWNVDLLNSFLCEILAVLTHLLTYSSLKVKLSKRLEKLLLCYFAHASLYNNSISMHCFRDG